MSLKATRSPKEMAGEVEDGFRRTEDHLRDMKKMVRRYHGPSYDKEDAEEYEEENALENHYLNVVATYLPRLSFFDPRWKATTDLPGAQGEVAEAVGYASNQLSQIADDRELAAECAVDYLFSWTVAMVTPQPRPEARQYASPEMWPETSRLEPEDFGWDAKATSKRTWRLAFHRYRVDKDQLIEHAKNHPEEEWDIGALEAIPAGAESRERGDYPHADIDRDEIEIVESWVPEYQIPEGEWIEGELEPTEENGVHGTIFTVGYAQQEARESWLRKPRGWYGPRKGPYVWGGTYPVPGRAAPLSVLQGVEIQTAELNAEARSLSRSARRYKRLVLVSSDNPRLAQILRSSPHDFVVPVKGLQADQVQVVEVGGISPQGLEHFALAKDRLDRMSGLSAVERGELGGADSATEVAVAKQAGEGRMAWIEDQYWRFWGEIGKRRAHFLYHDDRMVLPLGAEAATALGMNNPVFFGGLHDDESGARFEDLHVKLEPFSMQRTSEGAQQRNAMTLMETVSTIAPLMPTMPWVDWRKFWQQVGDMMNLPVMADLFNVAVAMNAPPPAGGVPGQSRFSRDLGRLGTLEQLSRGGSAGGGGGGGGGQRSMTGGGIGMEGQAQGAQSRRSA